MNAFVRFFRDQDAATAVEYAVMLALVLMAVISAIGAFGVASGGLWGGIDGKLTDAGFPGGS